MLPTLWACCQAACPYENADCADKGKKVDGKKRQATLSINTNLMARNTVNKLKINTHATPSWPCLGRRTPTRTC